MHLQFVETESTFDYFNATRAYLERHGNAVHVMRIATGEIEDRAPIDDGKDPAAVALGRKGCQARAKGMSAKRRKEIAKKAATRRWSKKAALVE